jgi:ribonuclease P protein component
VPAALGPAAPIGRLKKRSEFLAVAGTNRRWTTPGLVLQVKARDRDPAATEPPVRLGFTATKKIGNAVKRNRARRRLRAAVADVLRDQTPKAADLVLVARRETIDRDFIDLKSDITLALRRLGIVA